MSNIKKLMASAAGGGGLNVEDVFSTYLYTGNGTSQTITNGLDLAGEGGLIWSKRRAGSAHQLFDTARGIDYQLSTDTNIGQYDYSGDVTSVNSDGFSLGYYSGAVNYSGRDYATWSFRKAPKFFDVVTFTGTGSANTNISHSLGVAPGMIIIKRTNSTSDWGVWHRGSGVVGGPGVGAGDFTGLSLNATSSSQQQAANSYQYFTDTYFKPTYVYDDYNQTMNVNGGQYVAYLFAHNDGDGEFGPDGDADIIKCGTYTGNGSTNGPEIDLGFEPQWIMIKAASISGFWTMFDSMRGMTANGAASGNRFLQAHSNSAEYDFYSDYYVAGSFNVTSTGFKLTGGESVLNGGSQKYIYMAIRRGPMAVPESATDVFAIDTRGSAPAPAYSSGFPVDMAIQRDVSVATSNTVAARLMQTKRLFTDSNSLQQNSPGARFDHNTGWSNDVPFSSSNIYSWMWKRAPGYFDVVAYTGAYGGLTINHNLEVAPEMMWVKAKTGPSNVDWAVYHKDLATDEYLFLNQSAVTQGPRTTIWSDTRPSDSVFYAGGTTQDAYTSSNNYTYIAYLFATLPGISKVGSYTGTGGTNTQVIDCGFSAGARFVLVKCATAGYDWQVFDTERGIVSGNDPKLTLNTTQAQQTNADFIDPIGSGFAVTTNSMNANGETFIFYAVA